MDAQIERDILSLGILALTFTAMVMSRRSGKSIDVLLSAVVLAFGAGTFQVMGTIYEKFSSNSMYNAFRTALSILSIAALVGSWALWKTARRHTHPWLALVCGLLPLWGAGLWMAATGGDTGPLSPALALAMAIAWAFYQQEAANAQTRSAAEIERRQAALLQEQMQPHFTFNALSAIQNYCRTNPELAASGLENLSGYLRNNMDALTAVDMIPFEKELQHIEQYVALEKLNPLAAFEVIYELEVLDFDLPALTIQPLVENAIHHGVRLQPDGLVTVSTEQYGATVRITVEDNGPGFPEGMSERQKNRISHGLDNVRTRLESQCGGILQVHSRESGARMVVLIPMKRRG